MHGGTARVPDKGKGCAALLCRCNSAVNPKLIAGQKPHRFAVSELLCYLCGMAKTVRICVRVLPELHEALQEIARRGGFPSVPNYVTTLLTRMVRKAAETQEAWREEERRHKPTAEEEIAEMFGEYTDAEAPRYGERTKRTRRTECR